MKNSIFVLQSFLHDFEITWVTKNKYILLHDFVAYTLSYSVLSQMRTYISNDYRKNWAIIR